MIGLTKIAKETSSFIKAKFNISSDALFSTALFMGLAALVLSPESAHATGITASGVSGVICNIVHELQGNVVRGIAAFAVVFLGFSLFLGKITWGTALALGIGVSAVFGAEQIVSVMAGNSTDNPCTNGLVDVNAIT